MMTQNDKMERTAILHIPLSEYAFAESEYGLTIRIRAKKRDLTGCELYYADRVCKKTPIDFYKIPMEICAEDAWFSYYEAKIESPFNRVCYYFRLEKGEEWTYYYADRFTKKLSDIELDDQVIDGRSGYYQYPFILREEIPDVPAWFKKAVVYNIFPDSFASGKNRLVAEKKEKRLADGRICRSRLGGTIKGIRENLDYIQKMGFTCLYLNPIFTAGEYHKYDVLDYYHIDPCMGTEEELKELVEELHARGMKLVIDGVFNHCSWEFFAFQDVVEKGEKSRYCKWFYELEFPVRRPEDPDEIPGYACFAYERKMPKLNTAEREVQMYFADVGAYWIREYHVDGWRLDVANEIDRNFWRRFREAVKKENPEAVLIGEVWENAKTWLRGDAFDSVMNYEFRRICAEYLAEGEADARQVAWQFEQMRLRYPTNIVNGQLNLLDSHDVPRFLSLCGGDVARLKLACVLLLLMPGVPSLFYGDEQKIMGITETEYRRAMVWEGKDSLCAFIRELTEIRKAYVGEKTAYRPKWDWIKDGMFAFVRENGNRGFTAVLNAGQPEEIGKIPETEILFSDGYEHGILKENGCLIFQNGTEQGR